MNMLRFRSVQQPQQQSSLQQTSATNGQSNVGLMVRKGTDSSNISTDTAVAAASSPLRPRSPPEDSLPHAKSHPHPSHSSATHYNRRRFNSREYPRTYSGCYGQVDDFLPLVLNRHRALHPTFSVGLMAGLYVSLLTVVQIPSTLLVPTDRIYLSWTVTNAIHAAITTLYIHWLKGSMYDDVAGEMNSLTLWEQLEATQETRSVRELLMVVPCLLTWMACHAASYQPALCVFNLLLWGISMLAKLPFMNGVRLFGINRTTGVDDDAEDEDEQNAGDGIDDEDDEGPLSMDHSKDLRNDPAPAEEAHEELNDDSTTSTAAGPRRRVNNHVSTPPVPTAISTRSFSPPKHKTP